MSGQCDLETWLTLAYWKYCVDDDCVRYCTYVEPTYDRSHTAVYMTDLIHIYKSPLSHLIDLTHIWDPHVVRGHFISQFHKTDIYIYIKVIVFLVKGDELSLVWLQVEGHEGRLWLIWCFLKKNYGCLMMDEIMEIGRLAYFGNGQWSCWLSPFGVDKILRRNGLFLVYINFFFFFFFFFFDDKHTHTLIFFL